MIARFFRSKQLDRIERRLGVVLTLTETVTPDCPPKTVVETRVIKRPAYRRKIVRDKRVAI